MPWVVCGVVCQLNYHGGGMLRCLQEGLQNYIVFPSSIHPLRVGEDVNFQVAEKNGQLQAVDVTPASPSVSKKRQKLDNQMNQMGILKGDRGSKGKRSAPGSIHRLQTRIMKFQNSSADERLQQVEQAELELVEVVEEDGDALCRLLNRCVAWLRPAKFCRGDAGIQGSMEDVNLWKLQHRIRRILITILRRLDLDDAVTFQRVEVAVRYLQSCLPNLEDRRSIRSIQQWKSLSKLVESAAPGSTRKSSRGHCFKGHYEPSANVRSVSSVFRVDLPVKLHCSECGLTLVSCWRFQHPRTKVESVLVPRQGHHACEKRLKRRCKWMAPDGCKLKVDHHPHLLFCIHQRLKIQCIPCGGQRVCPHGRQKTECKECKGSRICPHNRFKDRCKECLSTRRPRGPRGSRLLAVAFRR